MSAGVRSPRGPPADGNEPPAQDTRLEERNAEMENAPLGTTEESVTSPMQTR